MPLKVVRRPGSNNLYLRGTVRGIPIRESTKTSDPDAAETARIKREAEVLNRSVFGRTTVTFLEAAANYMDTISHQDCRLVKTLVGHFKETPLPEIGQEEIDRAATLLYPKASNATRNRCVYTPVSAIMRRSGHVIALRRPRIPRPRNRAIRQADVERILKAVTDPHQRAYILWQFYTGTRTSEPLGLLWRDVDLNRRHATIYEPKTDRTRAVRIHERLFVALANLPRGAYVFPWRTRSGVYKWWRPLVQGLGLPNVTPHVGRHSFATRLREAGHDLKKVKEAGGWADLKSVERYASVSSDEIAEAVDGLPSGPKHARPAQPKGRSG